MEQFIKLDIQWANAMSHHNPEMSELCLLKLFGNKQGKKQP